jgi:hypothetical protein
METEDAETKSGEVLAPGPGPIDRAIGVVEDAAVALGFAKRIYEGARAILGSKTPVRDIMEDAGERAAKARAESDSRKRQAK